ncbi:MAG: ComEC family competence protein [Candidatus Omnitrophica bacterium]|nr:ComEC family competence protein [Candidatus Omnitrophota bacterium]
MNLRPLPVFTVVFSLGIAAASVLTLNPVFSCLLSAISLIIAATLSKKLPIAKVALLAVVFFLGFAYFSNTRIQPKCSINQIISSNKESITVKGRLMDEPVIKNSRMSFTLGLKEARSDNLVTSCCGKITVSLGGYCGPELSYGDELSLTGNLRKPPKLRYPVLRVISGGHVNKLASKKLFNLKKVSLELKKISGTIISAHLSGLAAAIVKAMVLGEKKDIPPLVADSMVKSGTIHILVVSGFNVGIVAFIGFLILKLARIPRQPRHCFAIAITVIYCFATGASTPVFRAAIMAIFFLIGNLLKREPDIGNSLSAAALIILILDPRQLFDIGFQLSFVSVISIVYLYPKLKALISEKIRGNRFLKPFLEGFLVSLAAWLGTMGFIAYHFRIFTPVTVPANIFIVPLASLITLCGFSLIAASLFAPFLAPLFSQSTEFLVAVILKLNNTFVNLPGAYFYLPNLGGWEWV